MFLESVGFRCCTLSINGLHRHGVVVGYMPVEGWNGGKRLVTTGLQNGGE